MLTYYIPYTISLFDGKTLPYKDIFSFRNILYNFFQQENAVLSYNIKTGDTPASLSYFLYGSEKYEWLIYCLNNIVNPYYDWPLSENDFYDMIEEKYLNKQDLFLKLDTIQDNFVKGEIVTNGNATAEIYEWDRNLAKLTIKNVQRKFNSLDTITSNSASATISRIVRTEDSLHHFQTESGVYLDPYLGYLQAYISGIDSTYVITNKQFEESVNNGKRKIYILKPEFVKDAEIFLVNNISKIASFDVESLIE